MVAAGQAPGSGGERSTPARPPRIRAVVLMGVSGCGKTTVGLALAHRMGWRFRDADEFHPPANVEKMRAGTPLNDHDRWPWLDRLNAMLRHSIAKGHPVVLACSALKQRYRDRLAHRVPGALFVHLSGSIELIESRLAGRQHTYMPASLLRSQFEALEAPEDAFTVDVALPVEEIVERVRARLLARQSNE